MKSVLQIASLLKKKSLLVQQEHSSAVRSG